MTCQNQFIDDISNGKLSNLDHGIPRQLKVLMLHGYTQSGQVFHAKTRAMEKLLNKTFPPGSTAEKSSIPGFPGGIKLIYATGPIRISPSDIIGNNNDSFHSSNECNTWGWWIHDPGSGLYKGLEKGLNCIASIIHENNGIDGVIGFSQGACAAALVASLLEPKRSQAFERVIQKEKSALAFPEAWQNLVSIYSGGLKFAVAYSGFLASHPAYQAFFEPKIQTPFLHFIGTLDSIVSEERTMALVEKCVAEKSKVVYHHGAHFVPTSKQMTGILIEFIQSCLRERESLF